MRLALAVIVALASGCKTADVMETPPETLASRCAKQPDLPMCRYNLP